MSGVDYEGLPFCGQVEPVAFGELRRDPSARWWLESSLPGVSHDQLRGAIAQAFDAWRMDADVHGEEATSPAQAHLLIRAAQIDGVQGVLADCQLPGPPVQLMRLDLAEHWVLQIGAGVPGNVIDVIRVLTHELGHFWGLGHAPRGSPNLMAPTYSRSIWEPQGQWELDQIVALYGPPRPTPPAPGENRLPSVIAILDQYGQVMASYKLGERLA